MNVADSSPWRELTNVEGLPLLGGHGRVRLRLQGDQGILWEVFYPAGVRSPEHRHSHDSYIYLLSGLLTGTVDGEPARLEPGQTLLHPTAVPHTVEAVRDSTWLEFKAPPSAAWK
ncbi:cupin domain-containing protein [Actinomadura sp. 9N215]|uniref:cupin domain-containing protein n=1 Tax=Actinomadura sp. 9N215 TaxID=3375150 RepID=UPI0037B902A0